EEPVLSGHWGLGPQVTAPPRAAFGIHIGYRAEQQHPPGVDPRAAHMRTGRPPAWPKAVRRPSLGESTDRVVPEPPAAEGDDRRLNRTVTRRHLRRIPVQSLGAGQLVVGEEPRLPVPHGHPELVADVAVVVKEEHAHAAMLGMPVNMDLVLERLTGGRRAAVV